MANWHNCRQIPLGPDQCWPTFYGIVTCKCCISVLHGPAIEHTRDPNIEGEWRGEERDHRVHVIKFSGKEFLDGQF